MNWTPLYINTELTKCILNSNLCKILRENKHRVRQGPPVLCNMSTQLRVLKTLTQFGCDGLTVCKRAKHANYAKQHFTADYTFRSTLWTERIQLIQHTKKVKGTEKEQDRLNLPTWRFPLPKYCCTMRRTKHFFFYQDQQRADVTSRWHKDAHSATSCTFTDFNFWFTRCFVSAGEIQGKIFLKEFKLTYTPTIYILVSLRPALSMNQCCYTKHECPSYVQ